jgi:pimeloyl-ACP methyl ester carboxylesterase
MFVPKPRNTALARLLWHQGHSARNARLSSNSPPFQAVHVPHRARRRIRTFARRGRLESAGVRAVAVPTLIAQGDKDLANPLDMTAQTLKVYDGAPHGLVIAHRDRLARDILTFARG